ncbi:unnamed protein product [Rhizoctonia solani]|uniref:NACHT domain-containing protein n=1 Tax=Rhizoctonia solani TaxID=456999 RepID=A0A8H3DU48_9AGAM|nr:unnamed protein product [Rhizoctonia solani]
MKIAGSTERTASQLQLLERMATDMAPTHIPSNTSESVGQPASENTPQNRLGEEGLKLPTTGIAQAADALKVSPPQSISDMVQRFAEMHIADGTVKEYEALRQRLQELLKVLDDHSSVDISPMMTSRIQETREYIERELNSIGAESIREQHGLLPTTKGKEGGFLDCCRRIQAYMEQLFLDTSLSTSLSINKLEGKQSRTNLRVSEVEAERLKNQLSVDEVKEKQSRDRISSWISRLPPSPSAWYDSGTGEELKRRGCTPGTRKDVLANLLGWAGGNSTDAVYWLNGMAGTGKTTIAYSVCKELADEHKLAASFFCSRLREECRDVKMIIPSIAYQLARFSLPFETALSVVIEKDQDAHHKVLDQQFETLVRKPMLAILAAGSTVTWRMVVVIDALDECDNKDSTRAIIKLLLDKAVDLPIKFILSSRPEPQIRDAMTNEQVRSRLILHELDTGDVQTDIKTYLQEELKSMKPPLEEAQIVALADRAGVLFIYAATAVRYIGYGNFRHAAARLRTVLDGSQTKKSKKHEEIDQLYMIILESALGDRGLEDDERDDSRQVLHTVICAREPLTVGSLSELLQIIDVERVRAAIQPLWSVLHVIGASELVTTLHASFPDFMFDSSRSKTYHCDSYTHNQTLAKHCFELIARTQPQFNLCGLESSYLPDESVPDIEERVAEVIPPELLYACRFWAYHVDAGKCTPVLVGPLRDFLSIRLLLWMEVLNLNQHMKAGMECMKQMIQWSNQFEANRELFELAQDAEQFVHGFASNPVSHSTPHIYMSMLKFWPKSSPIANHYAKYTHGPVQTEGTALDQRQLVHLSTWAFEDSIETMAISLDGLFVAFEIRNDVLVVDSSSGRVVLGPLKGHQNWVKSIEFSPDGTQVFAGSTYYDPYYATILGWDTRTGNTILGPLQLNGHTDSIRCLRLSPDCTCIATGSSDRSVRLWDAKNGEMLHQLGTQDEVQAMAFSPDGTQIVAGSETSLQIWDRKNGHTLLGPLTTPVPALAVSFSPDKLRIIYAEGETIYVLDARSGEKILGPIEGHTDDICCIRCSPDGRYIVSGSEDRTVRLWDAQNGNLRLGPLEAHTGWVTSVAFSPDGSRIISGCEGGLVCTWDARQRNLTSSSSNTPFARITCVKFSSDGTWFVSGSEDGTICIWNAHAGEMRVGPIRAHTGRINAVDFLNARVVSGSQDGEICVCDVLTGEVLLGPLEVHPESSVQAIAYSPDGKHIAAGSANEIHLWDAQTVGRVLSPLTGLQGEVLSIQFSPDGTRIVGSSKEYDNNIVVWDVSDGTNLFGTLDGHDNYVRSVSYSPDGTLIASSSDDETIIIWDASTGKKALGLLTGHSSFVISVHFSPDSTRLVSGSYDGTIQIWDVQNGETLFELFHGHEDWITSVEYSPDGTRILSRSDDMSVHIHDARSPEERSLSGSESGVGEWTVSKDGWVVDDQSRLLVWVPGDLRKALGRSRTVLIVPHGNVHLKFDKSCLGESWEQGYTSRL